jgi:hypothetical protein
VLQGSVVLMGAAEGERAGSPARGPLSMNCRELCTRNLDRRCKRGGGRGERDAARPWHGVSETGDVTG